MKTEILTRLEEYNKKTECFKEDQQHLVESAREKEKPELSLIMPAYNEGDNIKSVIEKVDDIIRQTGLRYELIVVDDGSIDDTEINVGSYARKNDHVRVVGYKNNVGKGFALRTGFSHAVGDVAVFMDSDADIDPKQVVHYVEALKNADIVVASKWHPQSSVDSPLIRRILSHGFNVLVKLLTGLRLSDTQTGLKAIRRSAFVSVFPRLSVKRFAFDVELLALANLLGLKVVELPINIRLRSLFSFREVWRMFLELLGITYRLRVLRWYQRAMK
ncbi:MAG: glycosyltransferase [Candidatus Bathyarchaeota archaeon]|nr:glycosyltransferase [Candidatus Bathyarchaeota archaeon]